MAMDRVYKTELTITAGTSDSSPISLAWALEDADLVSVEIIAPPGPSGQAGIRLLRAGTVIIPFNNQRWLVLDNEKITFPVNEQVSASGLTIQGYNNGIYDHTFEFRAIIADLGSISPQIPSTPVLTPGGSLGGSTVTPPPPPVPSGGGSTAGVTFSFSGTATDVDTGAVSPMSATLTSST